MPAALREPLSLRLLALLGVIAALYLAKAIFIPLAMAILLTFVLAPPVRILRGWGLPRVLSSVLVVLLACAVIVGLGALLGQQLAQLAERVPQYQLTIASKVEQLGGAFHGGMIERFSQFLNNINTRFTGSETGQQPQGPEEPKPAPVRLIEPPLTPAQIIQRIVQPLLDPLTTSGLIVIFVIFFLLEREDLRDRLIRLAGSHDLRRTTEAINDGARRLSRYFLAQTGLNLLFGFAVAIGLIAIGVPNPLLWGALAALLRFVPYVGAVLAAVFPTVLAIAVDPGWSMVIWTVVLFVVLEPLIGQVLEPLLYGHSTGLTPVAVIVSATFWTWIWGPIGLILSTPLAVCLAVLGRHIESLRFVEVMIGNEPPLTPAQTFYQRALGGNADEATEQVEDCLKESDSLVQCYNDVVLEALSLAQVDVLRGTLDDEHVTKINGVLRSVIVELSEETTSSKGFDHSKRGALPRPASAPLEASPSADIVCIAGSGPFDGAAAELLAQVLQTESLHARVESSRAISAVDADPSGIKDAQFVCLSYFSLGESSAHLRYAIRRARRRSPSAKIIACMWGSHQNVVAADKTRALGADAYARTLGDVITAIRQSANKAAATESQSSHHEPSHASASTRSSHARPAPTAVRDSQSK